MSVAALTDASAGTSRQRIGTRTHAPRLMVINPWARATLPGATGSAAYMTLRNPSPKPIIVLRAHSPAAQAVEFHESLRLNGFAQMRPMPRVMVPARGEAKFVPGGAHIMLIGVKGTLRAGSSISMTLVFADGDSLNVRVRVRSPG